MDDQNNSYQYVSQEELELFEELFRLYYPRLKSYALRLVKRENVAEDLVQEVFLKLWEIRSTLDDRKNLSSFIFTLLKNKCLNHLKHRIVEDKFRMNSVKDEAGELYHISMRCSGEYLSVKDMLIEELEIIILEMPPKCRTAFRLKWFEGKKIREIAEIMEISTTMVDKYLAKGIQIAKSKLDPDMFILFMLCLSESKTSLISNEEAHA